MTEKRKTHGAVVHMVLPAKTAAKAENYKHFRLAWGCVGILGKVL